MHKEMLDRFRQLRERQVQVLGHEQAVKAAVLVPLLYRKEAWHILFEKRAAHLKSQPGDICFPGGRVEKEDADPCQTALRETCEELGINREHVDILAPLDVLVTHYHSHIYPFVGKIDDRAVLSPDSNEVEEVFSVPLAYFLQTQPERYDVTVKLEPPEDFPYELIENGKNYKWRQSYIPEYFYQYHGYVIWGMTARILYHFVQLVKQENII
ncbi:8-oxo-dGTP pyrophosphatase MutT (NUDIX family) [Caldalkalibacillus uzonensis]|uniref:8-oxo-dGTP pyrophosphatase MutT (NUDIX family) n=1 Tax=Caldalkalibacillus uzonensis TaxID=353224 RepID=A0ABU0CMZ4_9BACI|nr:CoA pyrophosphatase [Caldalkalibacillus uzonensis]MDQ0337792.1 8-oxo-dGTP pyrophosphatase MutT (NUDIX family) [Caldalkalibacillus uzonensis]